MGNLNPKRKLNYLLVYLIPDSSILSLIIELLRSKG